MGSPILGIVIFLAIAFLASILWHYFLRRYSLATLLSTISITVAFNCLAFIFLGYSDTFLTMAVFTTSAYSLIISVLIGLPFFVHRLVCRRNSGTEAGCQKSFSIQRPPQ